MSCLDSHAARSKNGVVSACDGSDLLESETMEEMAMAVRICGKKLQSFVDSDYPCCGRMDREALLLKE